MADLGRPPLSIVLPVYDERDVIEPVLRAIRGASPAHAEIVAYDDGSRDGSGEILDRLAAEGWLRVVHGDRNRGFDAAATAALAAARGELVHYTDSDGQHDPADLDRLLAEQARLGADLVVGWKRPRRDPPGRLILSYGLNVLCRTIAGSKLHDHNCGFRLMTRAVRDAVLPRVGTLPTFVSTEMVLRAQAMGFAVTEVAVSHRPRAAGRSRSLPLARLPRILGRLLPGLMKLRRELRNRP